MVTYKNKNKSKKNVENEPILKSEPVIVPIEKYKYKLGINDSEIDLKKERQVVKRMSYMVALFPPALQDLFYDCFLKNFPELSKSGNLPVIFRGNLNIDNVLSRYLNSVHDIDDLPDIMVTYDLNNFYYKGFLDKILNTDNLDPIIQNVSPELQKAGIVHPQNLLGIIGADAMVMVADNTKFIHKPMPSEWYELLNPNLSHSIVICGQKNYQYSLIYLNYIKNYGKQVISHLKNNILTYSSPEDMLDFISRGNEIGASVYVMPYSYAQNIAIPGKYTIIWPNDGAIAIPILFFIKKQRLKRYNSIIDFITSQQWGNVLSLNGFASAYCDQSKMNIHKKLTWLGWDFIYQSNIESLMCDIMPKQKNK